MTPAAAPAVEAGAGSARAATVAVILTTYNHARFLASALDSVLAQTHTADEVILIDDGSTDDPASVVRAYPSVRFIRQDNRGLAAARNAGLDATRADAVVFLDADDRLLPRALEFGLRGLERLPDAAFVCGGHRRVDAGGAVVGAHRELPARLTYADLLRINRVEMHAAVTYRRAILASSGGFDAGLAMCEDYDVLLRLARARPFATFAGVVADYRQHGANMSRDPEAMLHWALLVHDRQLPHVRDDAELLAAWRSGRECWTSFYRPPRSRRLLGRLKRKTRALLPSPVLRWLAAAGATGTAVPVGTVAFGDFGRTRPISDEFGYDRGTPIDRRYIERFLQMHAADIAGRVLEVGDDAYSRRFGASRIARQDVLHIDPDAPLATIVGDLAAPGVLASDAYDCIVLTQTLHLVYDMAAAVGELHRALKPGGVLLLTTPGISRIDRGDWGHAWLWSLTEAAATRLLGERFGSDNVSTRTHGNVLAAVAFLQGIAAEEVDLAKLDQTDPCFPVIVTVRAVKSGSAA